MEDVIVLDELKKDIESTKKSIDSIIDKLNYLEPLITETHTASMDIYYGTYVTEWIEDLRNNGTSSETYKTPLRMEYLATYPDAVNNTNGVSGKSVEQIIFDYVIENNLNIGEYFKARDYPSVLEYHDSETFDEIIGNTTWFDQLCQVQNRNKTVFNNENCLERVFDNRETLDSILKNRLSGGISKKAFSKRLSESVLFNGLALVNTVSISSGNTNLNYVATVNITYEDGSVHQLEAEVKNGSAIGNVSLAVNGYITKIECTSYKKIASYEPNVFFEGLIKP